MIYQQIVDAPQQQFFEHGFIKMGMHIHDRRQHDDLFNLACKGNTGSFGANGFHWNCNATLLRQLFNPKGIAAQSPGLRGTSYPGVTSENQQHRRGCGRLLNEKLPIANYQLQMPRGRNLFAPSERSVLAFAVYLQANKAVLALALTNSRGCLRWL